ncbi:SOS response-associated peptidase [Wolinella succinogenes]|uniref:SOS response-associated peptidase n=1 Tax=Wolinella succinogenes TaxID=844 RepID=UPI002FCA3C5A
MCGRFTSLLSSELLEELFGIQLPPEFHPRNNIAPTQQIWIIRQTATGGRYPSAVRWGLVPHWAKDLSIGNHMINARCETVHEKPAFRIAIRARRCIIPASGFFEWDHSGKVRVPHYITLKDGSPLAFAGIWDAWKSPEGETIESCSILTTTSNRLVAALHDRMPVILHPTEFSLWLDRSMNKPEKLQRLYQPYPSDLLQEWEVSSIVNSASHDTPETIVPLQAPH